MGKGEPFGSEFPLPEGFLLSRSHKLAIGTIISHINMTDRWSEKGQAHARSAQVARAFAVRELLDGHGTKN